jgi:GntR family transcriptional regulator
VREQGRGTFVARPKVQQPLIRLTGFSSDMVARGCVPASRVLRLEMEVPRAGVRQALHLPDGHPVVVLERLRLANGEPMALEVAWLHFPGYERLLEEDLSTQSLYSVLAAQYGMVPTRAEQHIAAAVGPRREQQLLGFQPGAPVFLARRITYDQNGLPFETVESVYRADRYTFYTELTCNGQGTSRWRPVFGEQTEENPRSADKQS